MHRKVVQLDNLASPASFALSLLDARLIYSQNNDLDNPNIAANPAVILTLNRIYLLK